MTSQDIHAALVCEWDNPRFIAFLEQLAASANAREQEGFSQAFARVLADLPQIVNLDQIPDAFTGMLCRPVIDVVEQLAGLWSAVQEASLPFPHLVGRKEVEGFDRTLEQSRKVLGDLLGSRPNMPK